MTQPTQPTTSIRNRSSGAVRLARPARDEAAFEARIEAARQAIDAGPGTGVAMPHTRQAIEEGLLEAIALTFNEREG